MFKAHGHYALKQYTVTKKGRVELYLYRGGERTRKKKRIEGAFATIT